MTEYAWRRSIAGIAITLLGATALSSGPALAQFRQPPPQPAPSTPSAVDPGPRGGAPGAGGPLPGLGTNEVAFFNAAKDLFNEVDTVPLGLGPRFNLDGCGGCHAFPATGGTSPPVNPQVAVATANGAKNTVPSFIRANGPVREARFVNNPNGTPDGGVHDLFVITGRADAPGCNIAQPNFAAAVTANNVIFRIPSPTFGLGLVEAVPDSGLQATFAAGAQRRGSLGISGSFNHNGNDGTVTRFGWKAQNKSLMIFAGEAYNVEQGVTNDNFPNERETDPNCQFNNHPESATNFTDGTNGASPASGFNSDIVNFALFMRMLAPPTPATGQAPVAVAANGPTALGGAAGGSTTSTTASSTSISAGAQVFSNVGCSACHASSQTTGKSNMTGQSNVTFKPYSDFAVHDMGTGLQDRVSQGGANGRQFRSAPLWGVGQRLFFLHDGRTSDIVKAIEAHASSGSEANSVINNFNLLSRTDQQNLVNFIRSL